MSNPFAYQQLLEPGNVSPDEGILRRVRHNSVADGMNAAKPENAIYCASDVK